MPWQSGFNPNELFLEHNGVRIFHTYKNDETIVRNYHFGTANDTVDMYDKTNFDVRTLPNWTDVPHSPLSGGLDKVSNHFSTKEWSDFLAAKEKAFRTIIIEAIDAGYLKEYIDAAENRPKEIPSDFEDQTEVRGTLDRRINVYRRLFGLISCLYAFIELPIIILLIVLLSAKCVHGDNYFLFLTLAIILICSGGFPLLLFCFFHPQMTDLVTWIRSFKSEFDFIRFAFFKRKKYPFAYLQRKYDRLAEDIFIAIHFLGDETLRKYNATKIEIDTSGKLIFLGIYEPTLNKIPQLLAVKLIKGEVLLFLESINEYSDIRDFDTIDNLDKLNLVELLEGFIKDEEIDYQSFQITHLE